MKVSSFITVGLLALAAPLSAQDYFVVVNSETFHQDTVNTAYPDGYISFESFVTGPSVSSTYPTAPTVIKPLGGNFSLYYNSYNNEWEYFSYFNSQSELEMDYPTGGYVLSDGVSNVTLSLSGGLYPAVPIINVMSPGAYWNNGVLYVDATQDVTLYGVFGGENYLEGSTRLGISLDSYSEISGEEFYLESETFAASELSLIIEAGTLSVGEYYTGKFEVDRITDEATLSGMTALAAYARVTSFTVQAIPEPSTAGLLGLGLLVVAGTACRRERRG